MTAFRDTPSITDSVTATQNFILSLSDTPTFTEPISVETSIRVSDSPSITDSVDVSPMTAFRDTPSITDSVVVRPSGFGVSDTPTISDSLTLLQNYVLSLVDTITPSEVVNTDGMSILTISESPSITDSATVVTRDVKDPTMDSGSVRIWMAILYLLLTLP
jgi:hypothetical protein